MKKALKCTAAAVLTGALALAAVTPSHARYGRNAAAIGFGVGALAGAAIASSAYNNGYYYGYDYPPGYAYAPGYGYGDAYGYGAYGYAPAYRYNWSTEHSTNNFSVDSQR